jgi:tol-pal system protein YbgF
MKKFYLYLLVIAISSSVFAEDRAGNQIARKALRYDAPNHNDYAEKLELLEKEMGQLLGRIEIIEHNLSKLVAGSTKETTSLDSSNSQNPSDDSMVLDIFEIPSSGKETIKKTDQNISQNIPNVSSKDIAKDKQLYDLALVALKDNKLTEAEEQFANFIKDYPKSPLLSNGYFWYAESFFRRNKFDKSAINYLKGYKQSPKGAKAADSLLKLALSLGELRKIPEACSIIEKLEAEFPNRAITSITRTKDAKTKFGCKTTNQKGN